MEHVKPLICDIDVTPKKGVTIPTKWFIDATIPRPSIGAMTGEWRWLGVAADTAQRHLRICAYMIESTEDIKNIPARFYCVFSNGSRAPIAHRGRNLGNVCMVWEGGKKAPMRFVSAASLPCKLTAADHALLRAQVAPALRTFIKHNIGAIQDRALRILDDRMCDVIKAAREGIAKLNEEIETHLVAYKNAPIWDV